MRARSHGRPRSSKTPYGGTAPAPFRRVYGFLAPTWPNRGTRCRQSWTCSTDADPYLIPIMRRAGCARNPLLPAIRRGQAQQVCHPSLAPFQSIPARTPASDQRRLDLRSSLLILVTELSLVVLARTLRSPVAQAIRATRIGRFDPSNFTTLASAGTAATRRRLLARVAPPPRRP